MNRLVTFAWAVIWIGWTSIACASILFFDAHAADASTRPLPLGLTERDVSENGLIAKFIRPEGNQPLPVMLILGGSEGGVEGARQGGIAFSKVGYATLSVAYFGANNLPANLQNVPLEYFASALEWLKREPSVDARRIGIYGVSKGGEAALLVASRHPEIREVKPNRFTSQS